jgi:cGMP-dependent protein kinase
MEYISGINMGEYLETRKNKNNVFETKFYAALLLITINYLHKKKIIHRDIKPTNIMIDNKGYIKLIDFGTAKILKDNEKTKTVIGSPNFISPEVLLGKGYSFSCDYWSIGICIYYIYYGILPFGNNSVEIFDTYKEIIEKKLSFPNNNNFELNSLLNTLLDKNENNRNNLFKMLKTHFFFKDIDFHALLNYKIKPPFIPNKDQRINEDNLQNKNSPFTNFMENQKTDTKNTVTLNGTKDLKKNVIVNINENIINNKWYEDF